MARTGFKVGGRVKAMNRRLRKEFDHDTAEKIGHRWVLTDLVDDVWASDKEDIERQA